MSGRRIPISTLHRYVTDDDDVVTSRDIIELQGSRGAVHEVTFAWADMEGDRPFLACSCPSWRFQKLPVEDRSCKHTKTVKGEIEGSRDPGWPWHLKVAWVASTDDPAAHPAAERMSAFEMPDDLPDWLNEISPRSNA